MRNARRRPLYPRKRTSDSRNRGLVLTLSYSPRGGRGERHARRVLQFQGQGARLISTCRLALERVGLQYHSLRQPASALVALQREKSMPATDAAQTLPPYLAITCRM